MVLIQKTHNKRFVMKKLILLFFVLFLLPIKTYSADFADVDQMYFWDTVGTSQYYKTWLQTLTELQSTFYTETEINNTFAPLNNPTFTTGVSSPAYISTAADGAHYQNMVNGVAITAPTTLGFLSYYNGRFWKANGSNWTTDYLLDSTLFGTGSGEVAEGNHTHSTYADSKADTNIIEWELNATLLGAAATVPDEAMTFRIPYGVDYGDLYVACDGTTHTSMAIDLSYAATRHGTYTDEGTALTATFTHGATAESAIDVSSYGSLTAGQYINLRVSTASTGNATMCTASLELIAN